MYKLGEKFDLAIDEYKKAQQLGYDGLDIYGELGDIYQKKKKYDLSIASLKKAIELNPEDVELHANIGNVYEYGKEESTLAISEFKEAIRRGRLIRDITPRSVKCLCESPIILLLLYS